MNQSWILHAYLWVCERLYYELAGYYDAVSWLVSAGQWRHWQRGVWPLIAGRNVLELGCGTGAMLVEGAQRGHRIVGVDLSPAMVAIAANRVVIARSDAEIARTDGNFLPFGNAAFDAVVATFPAAYVLTPATIGEVQRVLRPNGRFVLLGVGVELHAGVLSRRVPLFYSRPNVRRECEIAHRVEEAGFATQWVRQRHGMFTVSALVAKKNG